MSTLAASIIIKIFSNRLEFASVTGCEKKENKRDDFHEFCVQLTNFFSF